MLPPEKTAAVTAKPSARMCAEMIGAVEKLISSLVEIASSSSFTIGQRLNGSEEEAGNVVGRQPTVLVCARDDALDMVNDGRAVFARDYMLRFLEALMGLIAQGNRSLEATASDREILAANTSSDLATYSQNTFRKTGMYWTISYKGKQTLVSDGKGLHYVAKLLRYPGREIHALALATCDDSVDAYASTERETFVAEVSLLERTLGAFRAASGDAGEYLDSQAKSIYKRRVSELRRDLEDAKRNGNEERAILLEEELDALIGELRRATGLRGRDRKAASAVERARINVTRNIKAVLNRIGLVHPQLEQHLLRSIKTGTFCSYRLIPNEPISWEL